MERRALSYADLPLDALRADHPAFPVPELPFDAHGGGGEHRELAELARVREISGTSHRAATI
ncbi:MAG: hypothetical protein ACKOTZ_02095 [Chloroflexota bacterium]